MDKERYIVFNDVELKPGTWIVTGRKARNWGVPYDYEAVIVNAWETGRDPEKFDDWEYEILIEHEGKWYGPYKINLDAVGFPCRAAQPLLEIPEPTADIVVISRQIIGSVDEELMAYIAKPSILWQ